MSDLLEVQDVSRGFGGMAVLRGVTLSVAQGSVTGLIGPNGAGKSTLFNIVSGFLKPNKGDVRMSGESITRLSVEQRSYAGLVRTFQTPQVFGHLTVRENLIAGCHKHGRTGVVAGLLRFGSVRRELAEAGEQADQVCTEFDLQGIADQQAGFLTAGKQRLVELARATISRPKLLCLDEPSSGLSTEEVAQLMRALRQINDKGITVLLVSHDMELMGISSIIHVLCFGEIIASGCMGDIQADPRVREAYLGA
jgi:branched-chain amino acid transport system ATP-binding protein/nonpolar-amino-acid-transporting ATPase